VVQSVKLHDDSCDRVRVMLIINKNRDKKKDVKYLGIYLVS